MNLERAGITDFQLQQFLESNPMMKDLRLRKCLILTRETFEYLAGADIGQRLETLHFTYHGEGTIDDDILNYIGDLHQLRVSEPNP